MAMKQKEHAYYTRGWTYLSFLWNGALGVFLISPGCASGRDEFHRATVTRPDVSSAGSSTVVLKLGCTVRICTGVTVCSREAVSQGRYCLKEGGSESGCSTPAL